MRFLQAYTLELEAEVAKLKELNQELRSKQVNSFVKLKSEKFWPVSTLLDHALVAAGWNYGNAEKSGMTFIASHYLTFQIESEHLLRIKDPKSWFMNRKQIY